MREEQGPVVELGEAFDESRVWGVSSYLAPVSPEAGSSVLVPSAPLSSVLVPSAQLSSSGSASVNSLVNTESVCTKSTVAPCLTFCQWLTSHRMPGSGSVASTFPDASVPVGMRLLLPRHLFRFNLNVCISWHLYKTLN